MLEEYETFTNLKDKHRLGVHSEADINPILFGMDVRHKPMDEVRFSRIGIQDPIQEDQILTFMGLKFPYFFSVNLCNHTGSYSNHL